MSFIFAGCGGTSSTGDNGQNTYEFSLTGFSFELPESVRITNGYLYMQDKGDVDYNSGVMMGWPVYIDRTWEQLNAPSESSDTQANTAFSFDVICVKDVNSEEEAIEKCIDTISKTNPDLDEETRQMIRDHKMIHQENGYVWLAFTYDKSEEINDNCKDEYNAFYNATDEIISNMKFFTPKTLNGADEGTTLSFETTDLNGNPISSETLFAQNKVTMINIWATTCGPCINEMPELEQLNKDFQANGGAIVGLIGDVSVDNKQFEDDAKAIIADTGVTYTNLLAWDEFWDVLPAPATPTTYFVDSKGRIIGDPIMGALPDKYAEKMNEYLSQAQ